MSRWMNFNERQVERTRTGHWGLTELDGQTLSEQGAAPVDALAISLVAKPRDELERPVLVRLVPQRIDRVESAVRVRLDEGNEDPVSGRIIR